MSLKTKIVFLFYLIANGFGFSVFVARGTIVSWYVLDKTNSTFLVGLMTSIPTMTLPLLSPLGGKLADSVSRKSIFLAARIAIFVIMIAMALVINLDFFALTLLVITSIIFGLTASIEGASTQNLLIDILGIENIAKGNGYKELFNSGLNALLPLIIGVLLTIISSSLVFWTLPVVGLLGVFFAYLLFANFKPEHDDKKITQSFSEVSVKDALLYAKNNENIRILLLLGFGMMLFWSFPQPLLPLYSKEVLNIGGSGYAILSGLYFAGSMIGSLFITLSIIKIHKSKILILSAFSYCIFMLLLFTSSLPMIAGILILASGVSHSIWWISMLVFLQTITKESYKGRIIGFYFALLVSIALGSIIGGFISEYIGMIWTVSIAMAALALIHSLAFFSSKKFRKLNLLNKNSF